MAPTSLDKRLQPGDAMMLRSIRKEVLEFAKVTERLLGAASLTHELTEEECTLIALYAKDLSADQQPWSKFIPGTQHQDPAYPSKGMRESSA